MLGLGWGEIFLIAGVALMVVGPERLPRLLRDLGRYYGQLRRAADDLRRSFVLEADRQDAEERYKALQERRRAAAEARKSAEAPAEPPAPDLFAEAHAAELAVEPDSEGGEGPRPSEAPDPNADDPEAPHPVQIARKERP
jgi:sec-independent protein translocase protein TatB